MRILDVYHKDVNIVFELGLSELKKIKRALDMAEINFNSEVPEEKEATEYLTKSFYSAISETIDRVEGK